MARYTGPKHRLCRREGMKLCNSPKCPVEKKGFQAPGQHGKKFSRTSSDFGKQLREKQKTKRLYGVLEKQFRRYYEEATKSPANTGIRLLQLLETRLDNIVYTSGFVTTRPAARQLVAHGNVLVDNKRVNVPSYKVSPEQVITLSSKALQNALIKQSLEAKKEIPGWLKRKAAVVQVARLPKRDEIESGINEQLIIEYYSR